MKLYGNLAKFYDLLYSYRDYGKEADFLRVELGVILKQLEENCQG